MEGGEEESVVGKRGSVTGKEGMGKEWCGGGEWDSQRREWDVGGVG